MSSEGRNNLRDERLGMLLKMISKMLCFQSNLSHISHGTTLYNETIAFGVEEKCVRCSTLSDAIFNLLLKGSDFMKGDQEKRDSRGIGVLDSINFSNLTKDCGTVFRELDISAKVHHQWISPEKERGMITSKMGFNLRCRRMFPFRRSNDGIRMGGQKGNTEAVIHRMEEGDRLASTWNSFRCILAVAGDRSDIQSHLGQ